VKVGRETCDINELGRKSERRDGYNELGRTNWKRTVITKWDDFNVGLKNGLTRIVIEVAHNKVIVVILLVG